MNCSSGRNRIVLAFIVAVYPAFAITANDDVVKSRSFLSAHPDIYWRAVGQEALKAGRIRSAFDSFRKSARYADKMSQALVSQMLWNGLGVDQNRPLAYAWMDLASERGYRELLVIRENYWASLSSEEQSQAIKLGGPVYDEFGDAVSKPRMDRELSRAAREVTGSRTGRVGTLAIPGSFNPHPQGAPFDIGSMGNITDGAIYFADKYWKPELYWKWQDEQWTGGQVRVLPILPSR